PELDLLLAAVLDVDEQVVGVAGGRLVDHPGDGIEQVVGGRAGAEPAGGLRTGSHRGSPRFDGGRGGDREDREWSDERRGQDGTRGVTVREVTWGATPRPW